MATRPLRGSTNSSDLGDLEDAVQSAIAALSGSGDDALTKAAGEGLPDRIEVTDWVERTKRLVLTQVDRSALRSEVPHLAHRLLVLLRSVNLRDGLHPESIVARFLPRLPAIRSLLSQDVEAAYGARPLALGRDSR